MTRDDFMTAIVGESFYFDNLEKCYYSKKATPCDGGMVEVGLKKENNNPHDANAVGVYSPYGQIGHLSRQDAIKYRKIVTTDVIQFVKCRIYSHDPSEKIFGAWINFDLNNPPKLRKKFLGLF